MFVVPSARERWIWFFPPAHAWWIWFSSVDAWNNLVKMAPKGDSSNPFVTYAYFADNRRASKVVDGRGDLDGTTLFYYYGQKVLEERDGSGDVIQQYVWGLRHIDELLMIRGVNGTYWAYEDANWNVMGLTDASGRLAEEYHYTPYGRMTATRYIAFGDSDGYGDVDDDELTAFGTAYGSTFGGAGWNKMFDADWDGNVDTDDFYAFWDIYDLPGDSIIVPNRNRSPNGNPYGYTTRRLDPETGLVHYRARTYNTELRQFMQRDPMGHVDGPNSYRYAFNNPTMYIDFAGLSAQMDGTGLATAARCSNPVAKAAWDSARVKKLRAALPKTCNYYMRCEGSCDQENKSVGGFTWYVCKRDGKDVPRSLHMCISTLGEDGKTPLTQAETESNLAHELYHAHQGCLRKRMPKLCDIEHARDEVGAYVQGGGCPGALPGAENNAKGCRQCIIAMCAGSVHKKSCGSAIRSGNWLQPRGLQSMHGRVRREVQARREPMREEIARLRRHQRSCAPQARNQDGLWLHATTQPTYP